MIVVLSNLLLSCDKNNIELPSNLDFKQFVDLLNLSKSTVKSKVKGTLKTEINTPGNFCLIYLYKTLECEYYIDLKFTKDDRLSSVRIIDVDSKSKTYSDGINFYKVLSDRIDNYGRWVSYSGYDYGTYSFNIRTDYWNYLVNHSVKYSTAEIWTIKNKVKEDTKLITETVRLIFFKSDNKCNVIIDRIEI